jgi:hypothetical protein
MFTIVQSKDFDSKAFDKVFSKGLKDLTVSERTSKALVADLAMSALAALHSNEDIQPVNRLLKVLSPANKKSVIVFFREFAGFHFMKDANEFGKKDREHYPAKRKAAEDLLASGIPFWEWFAEGVEIKASDFKLEKVTKAMEGYFKKAKNANIPKADVIRAIFAAGITAAEIAEVLQEV